MLCFTLLALSWGCRQGGSPRPQNGPPGVILISIDTLRPDHLGAYGYARKPAPHLDQLAQDGIVFENAYTVAPWTLPAHTTMFTGLYPEVHGVVSEVALSDSFITLAECFRSAGYSTGAWIDFKYLDSRYHLTQGFQTYDEQKGGSKIIIPKVQEWLKLHKTKPYFVFIHLFDVHGPYTPDSVIPASATPRGLEAMRFLKNIIYYDYGKLNRFQSLEEMVNAYDAGIRRADRNIGRLFETLKDEGLYDNATIAVVGDHGENLFDHSIYVGHNMVLYDEELHIPWLLKLPHNRDAGKRIHGVLSLTALMPTLLGIRGIPMPEYLRSEDLHGELDRITSLPDQPVYFSSANLSGQSAVRTDQWKWISPMQQDPEILIRDVLQCKDPKTATVLRQRLVREEQLFDIRRDPQERVNLAKSNPKASEVLRKLLAEYRESCSRMKESILKGETPQRITLSEDDREQLRALGYIN